MKGAMRFELLEGSEWRGDFRTRRAAIEDAELRAAKRGLRLRWGRGPGGVTVGSTDPPAGGPPFVVQYLEHAPWQKG